jgi:hypothetical protein
MIKYIIYKSCAGFDGYAQIYSFVFLFYFLAPQSELNEKGEQVGEWGLVKKCYLLAKFFNRY